MSADPIALSAPKHTPGPWRVDESLLKDWIIAGPKGEEVGLLYTNDGADDPEWLPVEANARLISAAPDMLDLLRACSEFADNYVDVTDGDDGQPRPNRAMSLKAEIDRLIEQVEG